jgi:putative transposase
MPRCPARKLGFVRWPGVRCGIIDDVGTISRCCCRRSTAYSGVVFGLLAVLIRSDLPRDVELLVLRHENQVLRRQARGRPRWDHTDRLWLTALSRLVSRRRWVEIFPVTPATILRWHRSLVARKWTFTDRRRPGRPSTGASLKTLILRMARENPISGP